VITDWRDGRIDGTYSAKCFRQALEDLPEDLRIYGSAEADIIRALHRTLAAAKARRSAPTATSTTTTAIGLHRWRGYDRRS
jgi:hypothetical protein